jgi:hypothetical protein
VHAGVETLGGLFRACGGEGEGDQWGVALGVPQGALHAPGRPTGVTQRGGGGLPPGRAGHAHVAQPGPVVRGPAGALDPGATHGRGRRRTWGVIAPGGGPEPGGVPRGCPGGAQQREGLGRQGDGAVVGALATLDRDLEALSVKSGDLQGEGGMAPQAPPLDRGAVDLGVEGGSRLQDPAACFNPADSGERGCGWRAPEREGVPIAFADVWREAAETAGAEAHGRWGAARDMVPVQEGVLQVLGREAVRGLMGELSAQAYVPDRGCRSPCALATEGEGRHHVLTQWAHEISPGVRRVGRWRRKTSETDCGRESGQMTAAAAAYLNNRLQPTPYSVRSYLGPASGRS